MKIKEDKPAPEKRLLELGYGRAKYLFLILVAWIGYWQLYQYVSESPEITVVIEKSVKVDKGYYTQVSIENGSESVSMDDIVKPIKLTFADSIVKINPIVNEIVIDYNLKNLILEIKFDLFNKNEKFQFYTFTKHRPRIISTECRIKNIKKIKYYDIENKPRPFTRVLNIWLVLFILSVLFLADAILVIIKDKELGHIKSYIRTFPLNSENIVEFLNGYEAVYKTYKVRIKPEADFMREIIANLFESYNHKTEDEIEIIKQWTNLKTEFYILYRTRTAFIIISPIIMIVSIIGTSVNYLYYETNTLRSIISLSDINLILLRVLLVITILIIVFPRRILTFLMIKKGGRPF